MERAGRGRGLDVGPARSVKLAPGKLRGFTAIKDGKSPAPPASLSAWRSDFLENRNLGVSAPAGAAGEIGAHGRHGHIGRKCRKIDFGVMAASGAVGMNGVTHVQ